MEVDSNHRSNLQQIYSLSPLATRESIHVSEIQRHSEAVSPSGEISRNIFAGYRRISSPTFACAHQHIYLIIVLRELQEIFSSVRIPVQTSVPVSVRLPMLSMNGIAVLEHNA